MGAGASTKHVDISVQPPAKPVQKGLSTSLANRVGAGNTSIEKFVEICLRRWEVPSRLFEMADEDTQGVVTLEEFTKLMITSNTGLNNYEIVDAFQTMDTDKSGNLDRGEICNYFKEFGKCLCTTNRLLQLDNQPLIQKPKQFDTKFVALICAPEYRWPMYRFVASVLHILKQVKIICQVCNASFLRALGLDIAGEVAAGALGGYQEVGAYLSRGQMGAMLFFLDALHAPAHRVDIQALCRLADTHMVPWASNPSSALCILLAIKKWGLVNWWASGGELDRIHTYKAQQTNMVAKVAGTSQTVSENDDNASSEDIKRRTAKLIVDHCSSRWINFAELVQGLDTNSDGMLAQQEFEGVLKALDFTGDISPIFDQIDMDGSGTIGVAELEALLRDVDATLQAAYRRNMSLDVPKHIEGKEDKFIALVAHNMMKPQMAKFVENYFAIFEQLKISTTGTTGRSLKAKLGLEVAYVVQSGPLGGDQELAELIVNGRMGAVIFFKDPLSAHQHAADIEALTRVCDVHQVPYASNASSGHAVMLGLLEWGMTTWLSQDV